MPRKQRAKKKKYAWKGPGIIFREATHFDMIFERHRSVPERAAALRENLLRVRDSTKRLADKVHAVGVEISPEEVRKQLGGTSRKQMLEKISEAEKILENKEAFNKTMQRVAKGIEPDKRVLFFILNPQLMIAYKNKIGIIPLDSEEARQRYERAYSSGDLESLSKAYIERDKTMTEKLDRRLKSLIRKGKKPLIIADVGSGHQSGIQKDLKTKVKFYIDWLK